ncbi:MAG TPA: hypothetical protein VHX65_19825 [Pirellulales bacterium]|jgi:hypothetical protein|nr:hypothetical protein [Pirellulales bacterium]
MANDTIGSMTAVVRATASQFSTDMKQVEGSLDSLAEKGESAGSRLKEAFEIAGAFELFHEGIEAAREAVEGFFESIERIGQLKNFAETVGATTQQVQKLRYAADEFHVESDQLDTALQRMQKTLGELNSGQSPELAKTFQSLGLSVEKLRTLDASEQFLKIGDAIKQLGNHADEAYATTQIFGRGAANLVNIFNAGSDAVRQFAKEAQDAGIVLSDQDVAAAEEAELAMKKLHAQWEALTDTLTIAATPALIVIADKLREVGEYLTQHAADITTAVLEWSKLAAEIGAAVLIFPKVSEGVGFVVTALREMAEAESIAEAFAGPEGIAALAAGAVAAGGAIAFIDGKFDELGKDASAALKKIQEEMAKAAKDAKQAGETIDKNLMSKEQAAAMAESLKTGMDAFREGERVFDSVRTPLEKYNDEMVHLRELLEQNAISMSTFARATAKAADELNRTNKARQELAGSVNIAGADVSTSAGAAIDISAGRFAQEMANQKAEIAAEQLAEAQKQSDLQQGILDAINRNGGGGGDIAMADF